MPWDVEEPRKCRFVGPLESHTLMGMAEASDITLLLREAENGSAGAHDQLVRSLYGELRQMAQARLSAELGPTLQATELVHEAWLRLGGGVEVLNGWENRRHFFGAAAEAMRRILVDRARARATRKRGGAMRPVPIADVLDLLEAPSADLVLALEEALGRLELESPEAAQIVTLRFFAGLSVADVAQLLAKSERTVIRKWKFAQAWLYQEMFGES
jgi:RNA polymerase sigma factor (TIGR02999 family)